MLTIASKAMKGVMLMFIQYSTNSVRAKFCPQLNLNPAQLKPCPWSTFSSS